MGGVSVLLGNGDGTFQAPRTLYIGTSESPSSVAVGDFNRDGAPDLAVANTDYETITVLLGNGDGTFLAATTIHAGPAGSGQVSLAAGDLNRDEVLDLVVANYGDRDAYGGSVWVLLGNGDGTFQGVQILAVFQPAAVALEDFNADGVVDLLVLKAGGVSILIGNGDGTFRESAETFSGGGDWAWSIVVGDFDGDRSPDVAVPYAGSHDVTVLLGNGDGTFQTAAMFRAGKRPWSAAVSDLNRDGKADLVIANNWSDTVSVLINDSGALAHDVTVVKDGSGSVTSDPAGIDCGADLQGP
jgi:hypothetical protein